MSAPWSSWAIRGSGEHWSAHHWDWPSVVHGGVLHSGRKGLVLIYTWTKYTDHPTEVLIRKGKYFSSLKLKVTLGKRTGKIPRKLFLQDILILNLLFSHLQRTQDPKCKLRFRFDVQIFLNHSVTRHELTSSWLHPYMNFTVLIYLEVSDKGRWI